MADQLNKRLNLEYQTKKPFLDSQILRGKLFIASHSKKIDKDEVLLLIKTYFNSQNTIYDRHISQIRRILNKFKISYEFKNK